MAKLMSDAGFIIERNHLETKVVTNEKLQLTLHRTFIQGKYTRPAADAAE
jgi:hypothetical protein